MLLYYLPYLNAFPSIIALIRANRMALLKLLLYDG